MPKLLHSFQDRNFLAPGEIKELTISPDGTKLIAFCGDYQKYWLSSFDSKSGAHLGDIEVEYNDFHCTFYADADKIYFSDELWIGNGEREYFLKSLQLSPEMKVEEMGIRFIALGYYRDYQFFEKQILAGNSNSLLVFDRESKALLKEIKGPSTENENGIAISPDGKFVAFGNWQSNEIQVFDIESVQLLKSFTVGCLHDQHGAHIRFLQDSQTLYVAAGLNAELWNASKGQKIRELKVQGIYGSNIINFCISKDDRYMLVFYTGLHLALFRLSDGEQLWIKTNMDGLHSFCFSADAKTVYYSEGMNIKQLETLGGEKIGTEPEKLGVLPNRIFKLPEENALLAFFGKQAMKLDADTGCPLDIIYAGRNPGFSFNEEDPYAAFNLLCTGDYSVLLYNGQSGRNKSVINTYYGKGALSTDYIAVTDGYFSNRKVKEFNIYDLSGTLLHKVAKHQKNTPVYAMQFLSDGVRIAGLGEKFIALWDAGKGTEIWKQPFKNVSYTNIYCSENANHIYFTNNKQLLFCINCSDGNTLWEYKFQEKKSDNRLKILFPVGKFLLLLGENGDIRLLDAASGKELNREILKETGNACACLDGSKLIVIHKDTALVHYDVSDWLETAAVSLPEKKAEIKTETKEVASIFQGKNLLFTGTLTVSRKEAEQKAEAVGAIIISGVNKKLDYLIVGEDAGSKLDKAKSLGVAILNEAEFWTLLSPKAEGVGFSLPDKALNAGELLQFFQNADWSGFDWERDSEALRNLLLQLEKREGLSEVHQFCSQKMQELAAQNTQWPFFKLQHRFGHLGEMVAFGLSPDGKYLATGSWVGEDYYAGGELMIWEMTTGRCVNNLDEVNGGVGWPDYAGCLKWSPDAKLLGMALDTNGVGVIKPFGDAFLTEEIAYLTDGWSRPPQWCWHPEGKGFYIACWGSDYFLPGQVVPLERKSFPLSRPYNFINLPKNLISEKDMQGVDLMENNNTGEKSPLSVYERPGWSGNGYLFGIDHNFAYTQNPMDRSIVAVFKNTSNAACWSPDGAYYLVPKKGSIEVYNVAFRELCVLELNRELISRESFKNKKKLKEIDGIYWHSNEKLNLFAAAVEGDDGYVAIYKDFNFVGFFETAILSTGRWSGDYQNVAFSLDGTKMATMSYEKEVSVWDILNCMKINSFEVSKNAAGILLGCDDILVTTNEQNLAFYDSNTGEMLSCYVVGLSNGNPVPALKISPLGHFADRFALNPYFPIAKEADVEWIAAFQSGLVVADGVSVEKLDEELCYTIGNRIAWPYRWVAENRVNNLSEALSNAAFPFPETVKKQIAKKIAQQATKEINRDEYIMSVTKKEVFGKNVQKNGYTFSDNSDSFWKDTKKTIQSDPFDLALKAASLYKLVEKLSGAAINSESLKPLLGKVVLYAESYSPTRVQVGTLISVSKDYCYIFHIDFNEHKKQGSSGSGGSSYNDLIYIGLAEPRG